MRMMQVVRGKKEKRLRAVIAVIREHVPQDGLLGPSYQYVPIDPIRSRAHGHGYGVEEFIWARTGSRQSGCKRSCTRAASRA